MSDDDIHGHDEDHDAEDEWRTTSPMQEFTTSQVGTGIVVLVVGLVLTFGLAVGLA